MAHAPAKTVEAMAAAVCSGAAPLVGGSLIEVDARPRGGAEFARMAVLLSAAKHGDPQSQVARPQAMRREMDGRTSPAN